MNKEIVINEENYESYKKLYEIIPRIDKWYDHHMEPYDKKTEHLATVLRAGIFLSTISFTFASAFLDVPGVLGVVGLGVAGFYAALCYVPYKFVKKRNLKLFKKDYPNIDPNVEFDELEKELKKYQELSLIPEDIKEQEENQTNYIKENINSMNLKEKYQALKDEISYIEQLETQEKYNEENKEKVNLKKYRV